MGRNGERQSAASSAAWRSGGSPTTGSVLASTSAATPAATSPPMSVPAV
jgi:hypothetical protein